MVSNQHDPHCDQIRIADSFSVLGKTTLPVHDFCIGLCFALYQRIFVGEELAKDPEWVCRDSSRLLPVSWNVVPDHLLIDYRNRKRPALTWD